MNPQPTSGDQKHQNKPRVEMRVSWLQDDVSAFTIRYLQWSSIFTSLHPASLQPTSNFQFLTFNNPQDTNQLLKSNIMQFHIFTTITLLIATASAIPTTTPVVESTIEKRTCGSLSGTALQVCQEACKQPRPLSLIVASYYISPIQIS